MTAHADSLRRAMPHTSAHPELGTGPIPVAPLISPELFALEQERIFKRVWLRVGRVEEIPKAGDFKVKHLAFARTSATLVRGRDDRIRAFHNLCTHRGNKIVQETGNETVGHTRNHAFSCRFHAWTFDTTGVLRGVAREDAFCDLDKGRLGLKPIACEVWEGFVFVNLDPRPRWSLREFLGEIGTHFAGVPYGEASYRFQYSTVLDCNWKVCLHACIRGGLPRAHDTRGDPAEPHQDHAHRFQAHGAA
jgi:phenylpropionate dioxygenase-like ring-hydroxylating dioxygenase large terminal subunit